MSVCACCKRELAGVAHIFSGAPAVCGRAACLSWALVRQPKTAAGR